MADDEGLIEATLNWAPESDVPVLLADQFAITPGLTGQLFLTMGQAVPPLLTGDEEERKAQIAALHGKIDVEIKVVARFAIPPQQLVALRDLLQRTVEALEKQQQKQLEQAGE